MVNALEEKREELGRLCQQFHVRRLEVFGSGTSENTFDPPRSDLDFLVKFDQVDDMNPADQYFGLWEELKNLFGLDVDLVTQKALRNPYFIKSVNATRKVVYAA